MPPRLGVFLVLGAALSGCDPAPRTPAAPDAAPPEPGAFFPCEVEAALRDRCQTCHTMPLRMGAPFPLLDYAQTQRDCRMDGEMKCSAAKVWQAMKNAIESGFMPLAGSPTGPLTAAEKTALLDWLRAGAPSAPQPCPGGR